MAQSLKPPPLDIGDGLDLRVLELTPSHPPGSAGSLVVRLLLPPTSHLACTLALSLK